MSERAGYPQRAEQKGQARQNRLIQQETLFVYKARDPRGETKEGQISAYSLNEAIRKLEKRSFSIIALEKAPTRFDLIPSRIRFTDLITLFRALSTMSNCGLNIRRTLNILESQADSPVLKAIFFNLYKSIDAGKSFSEALGLFPGIFTNFHRSIIRASERGGFFSTGLGYLADILEREMALQNKVRAALNYPIVIFCVGILICMAVMYWIIPMLTSIVKDMGVKLPFYSRMLIFAGECLRRWEIVIPSIFVLGYGAFMLFRYFSGTMKGKMMWDRLSISIPVVGEIRTKAMLVHTIIMLAYLTKAGENVVNSLELAGNTCDNVIMGGAFQDIANAVKEGETIGEGMSRYPRIFPRTLVAMVVVGEESGELEHALMRTSTLFEIELQTMLDGFTKLIEPLAIIVLGFIVSVLLLSMFVPIYSVMGGA
jgi:type II secretory pathway component PulF